MNQTAIGVDIGGTSVKLGLVDRKGNILVRDQFPTGRRGDRARTLAELARRVRALRAAARSKKLKVLGLGVGAPGPIDVERGFVYFFPNIPGWNNVRLRDELKRRTGLVSYVDNDANAMALGEQMFGAAKGFGNVIALTLGTGVGGGLVIDGRLFHGPTFSAAELGHVAIDPNGPRCGCGSRGCIETYVGNGYLVREARKRLDAGEKSVLKHWLAGGKETLSPRLIGEAALEGDRFAIRFWTETGVRLGTFLAGLVNVLNPERIVLGGGVATEKPYLFAAVKATIREKAFPIAAKSVKVVPAKLGADAGLIGAASLAFAGAR